MVARQAGPLWTVEQYLAMERQSTIRHEYHRGYVYAMAGGTQAHSQISVNVVALLRAGVRGSACRALNGDIKIYQSATDYVYADAVITCDSRDDRPGQDWIAYPTVVVEVLSPSTEAYDRHDKFEGYGAIETLREYVLIDSQRRAVEVRRRGDTGEWTAIPYGIHQDVPLLSLGLTLPMDALYEDSGLPA